jgi:heterodisulfide reductase subunit A-like polyferredoxin/coenzyme F420-reducing hydrogenase delta subunit
MDHNQSGKRKDRRKKMNEASPGVLIVGGGVAGMAAAQLLSDFKVSVHVVEKRDRLGGHSAMWPCMATRSCVNCGACLSIEMASVTASRDNVTTHLNTRVKSVEKSAHGFAVALENGEDFAVQKIIVATGFTPFDPAGFPSYHVNTQKNVITTAKLNEILKEESLEAFLGGKSSPEIAFIQCVGSRNRKIGNDYCSQVCCKVAMRHVNKLLHRMPDARLTMFYMDLQLIGKETRSFYNGLSGKAALVQGVPAEILENPENSKLKIVVEDREDMSRVTREFDMVVLSVGMEPSRDMGATAGMLGLQPDSWGFFSDGSSLVDNVYIAGCARAPGDILTSMQDGRVTAGKVLADLDLLENPMLNVAVFGDGPQAQATARGIAANGATAWLFGTNGGGAESDRLIALGDAKIFQVSGTAGKFDISYDKDGRRQNLACAAIVSALEPVFEEVNPALDSPDVISPEAFASLISENPDKCPEKVVILFDYSGPENKNWVRMGLKDAIRAKSAGKKVSIVANKMLVHKADGQRLYDRARKEGVSFFRYENLRDIHIERSQNGIVIALKEATLPTSLEINIECDCLVLPPKIHPPAKAAETAAMLKENVDQEGFLQSPNVRHRLTRSPRKGIFFAGSCHDECDGEDLEAEIKDIIAFLKTRPLDLPDVDTGVKINEKMCAQCLTCYRICPHSAIVLTETMRPRIVSDACFSCHLCVANCPAYAIDSDKFPKEAFAKMAKKEQTVIFACERSAYLAASGMQIPDNVRLVKIPCACRINSDVILKSLLNGASRVIVTGCYEGNCRSTQGAREAALGVKQVLRIPGMDDSRAAFEPVAANETAKIRRIISKA